MAATGDDFYQRLYDRGIAHFNEGNYDAARRELRIAAFGFIESVERFEIAQAYLVATARRANREADARQGLQKLVNAEKVQRHYAALALPAPIRESVESAAHALLGSEDLATLHGTAGGSAALGPVMPPTIAVPQAAPAPPAPTTTAPNAAPTASAAPTPASATTTPQSSPRATTPPTSTATPTAPTTTATPTTAPTTTTTSAAPTTTTAPAPTSATTTSPSSPRPMTPATQSTSPSTPTTPAPRAASTPTSSSSAPSATTSAAPRQIAPPPREVVVTVPMSAPVDISAQFAAGDAAIAARDLVRAREAYGRVLDATSLSHRDALRATEGLYRARAFGLVIRAFGLAGTLARAEEPYRYYLAVALYETGQYAAARRELAAVLPFIELTPDVARYQQKIQRAIE